MCPFLLPLFYSESTGRLWTSQIKVYYEGMDHPARIRIENRTPTQVGEVIYVHPLLVRLAVHCSICSIHSFKRLLCLFFEYSMGCC